MDMILGLREAEIRFVVVGGVSARLHGTTWMTDDLDICYALEEENLRRLTATLRAWGATYRERAPGSPTPNNVDEDALRGSTILNLRTNKGDIDVLSRVAGVGGYEACLAVADEYDLAGQEAFAILDVPALIEAKRAAGREKDRAHLLELEALPVIADPSLSESTPDALYHRLRNRLGERLAADDALTVAVGAFARVEQLERMRLLARKSPEALPLIEAELASLPPKERLATEIRDLATAARSGVHRLSTGESAAVRRAAELARRQRPGTGPRLR